jgi:uncharacterized protein YheU (UPF0270 family)
MTDDDPEETLELDDPAASRDGSEPDENANVIVPWQRLSDDALRGVIVEFVTREGTEYGEHDVSLDRKIDQVTRQLERGEVLLLFHATTESVNLVRASDLTKQR